MADMFATQERVRTRGDLPAALMLGRKYFVEDEGVIVIDWGEGPREFGAGLADAPSDGKLYGRRDGTWEEAATGGGGGGASVVDALGGGQTDAAPSVRAVDAGLATKPTLSASGKLDPSVIPDVARTDLFYRGAYPDDAALAAAHPTDDTGAYATVMSTGTMWIWDGAQWADTGTPPAQQVTVVDALTSTSATDALSAAQGKALNEAKADKTELAATETQLRQEIAAIPTGGGGIADAPSDGKLYGRKDGAWGEVVIPTPAAPMDALGGGETDRAPTVRAVDEGLAGKIGQAELDAAIAGAETNITNNINSNVVNLIQNAASGDGRVIVTIHHIQRKTATSVYSMCNNHKVEIIGAEVGDGVIVSPVVFPSNASRYFYLLGTVTAPGVVTITVGQYILPEGTTSGYNITLLSLDICIAVLKRPGGSDALYAQLDGMDSAALEAVLADPAQVTTMRHILTDPVRAKAIMDDAARMQTVMESDTARGIALSTNTSLMAIAMSDPARGWLMSHNDIFQAARRTIYDTTTKMADVSAGPWYRQNMGTKTGSSKLSGHNGSWRPLTTSYGPGFVFFCFGVAQLGGASSEMCRVVHPDGTTAAEGNGGGLYQPSVMQSVDAVSFDNCTTVGAGALGDVANNGSIYAEPTFISKFYAYWAL